MTDLTTINSHTAAAAAAAGATPAAATSESTAEAGTTIQVRPTIKPPEKQFSNLQEKQPYVDKWICQR